MTAAGSVTVAATGIEARLAMLVSTLAPGHSLDSGDDLREVLVGLLDGIPADVTWLLLSVLRAELPDEVELAEACRLGRRHGPAALLERELDALQASGPGDRLPTVLILTGAVTVDVHHTANFDHVSGIQRVVRETVARWAATHPICAVAWTDDHLAMRPLKATERERMRLPVIAVAHAADVLVPWRGVHIVPELASDPVRSPRILALARHAQVEVGTIGYDCIPVTSSETVAEGASGAFATLLAAVRHTDRLAAISSAAAVEYRGWRRMIRASGHPGPDILEIELPVQAAPSTPEDLEATRALMCVAGLPLVLVVGSHEPRKNHLAVLHAAELLWREGARFTLTFVGSGSWRDDGFRLEVGRLQAIGRPIEVQSGLPDANLWAAYRLAHCVLFPSLNEGFGLPVAEALAAGTPVITSGVGSMAEIVAPEGEPLGGLLVDPHDDRSVAGALRRLVGDPALHRRLRGEAAALSLRTWDSYAAATWSYLVEAVPPEVRISSSQPHHPAESVVVGPTQAV